MRRHAHPEQLARDAERALLSATARQWYRAHRSDDEVAHRLEAVRAYRDEVATVRARSPWQRALRRIVGLAVAAAIAAALWLGVDSMQVTRPRPPGVRTAMEDNEAPRTLDPVVTAAFSNAPPPTICTSLTVAVGNASGHPTLALALVGARQASLPVAWQDLTFRINPHTGIPIEVPAAGTSMLSSIPCDHTLPGMIGYVQTVVLDPSASDHMVFAVGLKLVIDGC